MVKLGSDISIERRLASQNGVQQSGDSVPSGLSVHVEVQISVFVPGIDRRPTAALVLSLKKESEAFVEGFFVFRRTEFGVHMSQDVQLGRQYAVGNGQRANGDINEDVNVIHSVHDALGEKNSFL